MGIPQHLMADRIPVYYWDTCIFLEHLKEEDVEPSKKRAILQLLEDNRDKKNRIITSTLTHAEALPRKITITDATKELEYWSYFNGVFFIDAEVSRQVIALARDIRDFYFREADPKSGITHRMLGLGDAIHIATAIIADVDEFHTRDKKPSGGNIGLLKLLDLTDNGKVAGQWPLKIIDPRSSQGDILDGLPNKPAK